jgi:bisphosphoglycerate-independent phosphoglycerate mutase (AlkP superfamily)
VKAHGTVVGLPSDGDMGNSEVGHNALGAGRIFAPAYVTSFFRKYHDFTVHADLIYP